MISTGDLKKGINIQLDGELYNVLDNQHIKMGRGTAQVRLRLRSLKAGHITERTFQAGEKFLQVRLESRSVQYLYGEGDLYYFMDNETFEQRALSAEQLGDALSYIKENMALELLLHDGEAIGVELPVTVDLRVAETPPSFKGNTASGGGKPAVLETGLAIQVPFFVNVGDMIRVDTRAGRYVERAS
ncbi:MAG: elongation factor P [Chloroflexi bacterium]|nr:elongation factor P [Chloroflexota bacterium]